MANNNNNNNNKNKIIIILIKQHGVHLLTRKKPPVNRSRNKTLKDRKPFQKGLNQISS